MLTWIFRTIRPRGPNKTTLRKSRKAALTLYQEKARALVHSKLEYFNQFYNFKYNSVRIKSATSRWGSCSSKGNLNFSYKVAILPEHLVDYLIVHELCHLGEFNHGEKFWALVAKTIPNHKEARMELRKHTL